MTQELSADPKRDEGRGTRDEKNGRARLLPSQIFSANREVGKSASREGRIAIGELETALTTHPRWVATISKQAKAC